MNFTGIVKILKYYIFSSIARTDPPSEESSKIFTEVNKNRSFKWDQTSGQFSFSQEDEAHLQRAVEEMEEMCGKCPDTVAVLLRQYSGETCSEVLIATVYDLHYIAKAVFVTCLCQPTFS